MVKTFESAIKIVIRNKRKWLLRLSQTATEVGTARSICAFVTHRPPGRVRTPTPTYFCKRNVETPYRSLRGQQAAKSAYGGAGTGSRRKRTPSCNGVDRGCRSEHYPTRKRADFLMVSLHKRVRRTI